MNYSYLVLVPSILSLIVPFYLLISYAHGNLDFEY